MSEQTTQTKSPAVVKFSEIREPKEPRDEFNKEIRWTPIKVTLVTTMLKMGATSAGDARTIKDVAVATKGVLTPFTVGRQTNDNFDLMIQQFVKKAKLEDGTLGLYLSKKGILKAQLLLKEIQTPKSSAGLSV